MDEDTAERAGATGDEDVLVGQHPGLCQTLRFT